MRDEWKYICLDKSSKFGKGESIKSGTIKEFRKQVREWRGDVSRVSGGGGCLEEKGILANYPEEGSVCIHPN